jgi:hypothetical protein
VLWAATQVLPAAFKMSQGPVAVVAPPLPPFPVAPLPPSAPVELPPLPVEPPLPDVASASGVVGFAENDPHEATAAPKSTTKDTGKSETISSLRGHSVDHDTVFQLRPAIDLMF